MIENLDTIIGLSSGALPSGIAIIRMSGRNSKAILKNHSIGDLKSRTAKYCRIMDPTNGELLDTGIAIWFPGPESFTGEDCAELHIHGGQAVVQAMVDSLLRQENTRLAEAGEFSRRAFENGKFDLTEIEGLSDLLRANTEEQRRQAVAQGDGKLRERCEVWRARLIEIQALIAADIDFVEEDDVPEDIGNLGNDKLEELLKDVRLCLSDQRIGEIIRDGFRVVILGEPNVGKSSLLNVLAKRDVAIVTQEAGTTRDVLDVHLDIGGYEVIVSDTAGIRETENIAEKEGIRRAKARSLSADLVVMLREENSMPDNHGEIDAVKTIILHSKDDEGIYPEGFSISCKTGHGINWLLDEIKLFVQKRLEMHESGVITRTRHRNLIVKCAQLLDEASRFSNNEIDLKSEVLRSAGDSLGQITGKIDVEDLLDVIFSEFCVGK